MATATVLSAQEIEQQFADKAAELQLKTPVLPFDSICMDGKRYKEDHGPDIEGPHVKTFPIAAEDAKKRLRDTGKMWSYQGTLEFVDEQGRFHIARDVKANTEALKAAGFKYLSPDDHGTFFTNGPAPFGEAGQQFRKIQDTPENAQEQLTWAAQRGDSLASFDDAVTKLEAARAAKPVSYGEEPDTTPVLKNLKGFNSHPLIFDAIRNSGPDRDAIVRRLLPDAEHVRFDGKTILHTALENENYNTSPAGIIPDMLKAGVSPFQRDNEGVPAFLAVRNNSKYSNKEEFAPVAEAMLKARDLTPAQRGLVQGHIDVINGAIADKIAAQAEMEKPPTEQNRDVVDKWDQGNDRIRQLRGTWKYAHHVSKEPGNNLIPERVATLLEPLASPKRAPKFMETLTQGGERLDGAEDMVKDFTRHVVLPQVLLDYAKQTGRPLDDDGVDAIEASLKAKSINLMARLTPVVRNELFKDRSLDKIIGLSEAWHDPRVPFPAKLLTLKVPEGVDSEWHSLTGQKTHDIPELPGVTIHAVTHGSEIKHEGKIMAHCVGDYEGECLSGKAHVFSVRREGDDLPISTIGGRWDGKEFRVFQNHGYRNDRDNPLPGEAKIAESWLKQQLESEELKASSELGETKESRRLNGRSQLMRDIGFEITQDNVNAAFAEYTQNERRRARELDPKTKEFSVISRQTELVAGGTVDIRNNAPESGFVILGKEGKPKQMTINYKQLSAEQWFETSGMRDKAMGATLQPEINRELAERQAARDAVLQEQARQKAAAEAEQREAARREAVAHSTAFHAEITPDSRSTLARLKETLGNLVLGDIPQSVAQQATHQERLLQSRAKGGAQEMGNPTA